MDIKMEILEPEIVTKDDPDAVIYERDPLEEATNIEDGSMDTAVSVLSLLRLDLHVGNEKASTSRPESPHPDEVFAVVYDPLTDSDTETSDSDIDYAQEELIVRESSDDEQNTACASDVHSLLDGEVEWVYNRIGPDFRNNQIPFTGLSGPQKRLGNILDGFCFFFDGVVVDLIVRETNRHADAYILRNKYLKPTSRVRKWQPVTADEVYVVLGIVLLTGVVQKPTVKSYFSRDPYLETRIFGETMSRDRFELIMRFLHFVDNDTESSYSGPAGLFKIMPVVELLNQRFQAAYLPHENVCISESPLLCKRRLSLKQHRPLKSSKTYELCESSTGYLWKFISDDSVSTGNVKVSDKLLGTKIAVSLMEPLLHRGYSLWMYNYFNSPYLAALLKEHGVNVAGTLRPNRKHVPHIIKKTIKRGEIVAGECNGVVVMKWRDKEDVTFVSNFHDITTVKQDCRGVAIEKPKCIVEYNLKMRGLDVKNVTLQHYLLETKWGTKCNVKLFNRLLNGAFHNAYVIYNSYKRTPLLVYRLDLIKSLITTYNPQVPHTPSAGRPSINPPLKRLLERHFIEKLPPTPKKLKPQRNCCVCTKHGRRKATMYWCRDCAVALCLKTCFKAFHTKLDF